jgi:hypothetical protein
VFVDRSEGPWLFGRNVDLLTFGGSALVAVGLVALGAPLGWLARRSSPEWVWLACIVAIDVAHVWSTSFRVYLDGAEVRRRPLLYFGVPLVCYAAGVGLYALGPATFWTVLAYAAVFHFVRQQAGWVALYRRRAAERARLDRWLDTTTIYAATVVPLIWWHGHLPRQFVWFLDGDFVTGLARPVADALVPAYWLILAAFVARQGYLAFTAQPVNQGKVLLVLTTWLCWWLGIIALDSDYAFTVTNVLIHGVPYLVLTYRYGQARRHEAPGSGVGRILRFGVTAFIAFVVVAALLEETMWDRYVWHDREWLFGVGREMDRGVLLLLVPLLALPQAVHYALDAWVWRVTKNPVLRRELTES